LSPSSATYLDSLLERSRETRSGTQVYDVAEPLSSVDTVGQPLRHCWAAQCSTGEAVFIDDIPPALGAGFQIKYSTHTLVDCTRSTMDCFLDDCDVGQRPSSGSADSLVDYRLANSQHRKIG